MILKFDVSKDKDGFHSLNISFDVIGEPELRVVVPLGLDVTYSLYKGAGLEFRHIDAVLSALGIEGKAKALEANAKGAAYMARMDELDALNESKDEAGATPSSVDTQAADQVCTQ